MPSKTKTPQIPLPKSWGKHVKSAILHVIALAQYALTYSRSWAADSSNQRLRIKAELDRVTQELALLNEEIRIKDLRMAQIVPKRRPHFPRRSLVLGPSDPSGPGQAQVPDQRQRGTVLV